MVQINFTIDEKINSFIELKMKSENKSKAAISREIFLMGLNNELLPYLAELYKKGEISIKKIALITDLSPMQVMDSISHHIEDIDIEDEDLDYSQKVAEVMQSKVKNLPSKGFSLKGTINDPQ